jgi:uncharacterized membrane protein YdbT with pleckstrin-like domain
LRADFFENRFSFDPTTYGGDMIAIGVFAIISPIIDYATSEFGVTNKRVIIKVGFLRRRTLELLLKHVEAISVDQSVIGRILGFGSITLTGTGGVREVFHSISSPLEFRRQIQGEASQWRNPFNFSFERSK